MTETSGKTRTRRGKGKQREEMIVDAAALAIAERGLANVRVSDVAERAGMSSGHVTYYFPAKDDLLMRAIRQSEETLTRDAEKTLATIRDPWKRLDRLVALSASAGPSDPGWILWFQVWTSAAQDADIAAVHDELDARWRGILTDVIRYGCESGTFHSENPDEAARLLSATIDGLSIQLTLGSPSMTRTELLRLCRRSAELLLTPDR